MSNPQVSEQKGALGKGCAFLGKKMCIEKIRRMHRCLKKPNPLQSKSEIILRNIVVLAMVIFFTVFLIVPIGIAFAGSFHEWNPLSGTYRFLGLENYKEVFTSALFGKSMLNTVIFSVVVIFFRVGLGLGIAYAIYSTLIKL